jgi:hypothetical protein
VAAEIRDTIAEIARSEVVKIRPADKYAEIQTIDELQNKATVTYPGETTAVPVSMGSFQPVSSGAVVRISGQPGDRYIQDVVSGAILIRSTELYLERSGAVPGRLTIEGGSGFNDWVVEPNSDDLTLVSTDAKTFRFEGDTGNTILPGTLSKQTSGWLEINGGDSKLKIVNLNDPTLAGNTHGLDIGGATDGSGSRLKIGPTKIQAVSGTSQSFLDLNGSGGPILGRGFQIAPVRNLAANLAVGSGASSSSTTQQFQIQAGVQVNASCTAGACTFNWPTAWANGVIACFFTGVGNGANTYLFDSTSTVTACKLFVYVNGSPFAAHTGNATFHWWAIGW